MTKQRLLIMMIAGAATFYPLDSIAQSAETDDSTLYESYDSSASVLGTEYFESTAAVGARLLPSCPVEYRWYGTQVDELDEQVERLWTGVAAVQALDSYLGIDLEILNDPDSWEDEEDPYEDANAYEQDLD